jgi:CheY-like chemotaxis protein
MIAQEEFGQLVRDALARLYDTVHLQTHPLIDLLGLQSPPWGTAAEALRSLLREAIESLKPPTSVPADRPEWLGYSILCLRFVRLLGESQACQELNVSVATLYRRQRDALDALVSVLWDRYTQLQAPSGGEDAGEIEGLTADQARSRAISLAGAPSRQAVDLVDLLAGIKSTIHPLVMEKRVTLTMDVPPQFPAVYAHPAVLRQVFIGILAECIRLSPGSALELGVRLRGSEAVWQVRGLSSPGEPVELLENQSGFRTSQALLDLYRGRLWFGRDEDGRPLLRFTVPTARPRCILVIDDDAATVALYRRYLERQGYVVVGSRTPEDAQALLAESAPDLILLDVVMPDTDGWTVLQRLKASPETAGVPVVVCSVIDQPDLALTLGAAQVLTKPISPQQLVHAVQAHLAAADAGD